MSNFDQAHDKPYFLGSEILQAVAAVADKAAACAF
jgi:hypothetical protein